MWKRLAFWAVAVLFIATLLVITIPNFVRGPSTSGPNACVNQLKQIEYAKLEWALEHNQKAGETMTWADLLPYLRRQPYCPVGDREYTIGPVGTYPSCWREEHNRAYYADKIFTEPSGGGNR